MNINVMKTREGAIMPEYAHATDAGMDLYAAEDVIVEPGATVKIPTGIAFEIPPGYEIQIRPRSGITSKTKLRVQLGTVDSGYIGEVSVIVDNIALPSFYINNEYDTIGIDYDFAPLDISGIRLDYDPYDYEQENTYKIRKGDKIAQAVVSPIVHAKLTEVSELGKTDRGANGFGSTGVKGDESQ